MTRFTRWILLHKRSVALIWVVVALISLATISSASNSLSQSFTLPGQPGFETDQAILSTYGNGGSFAPAVPVMTLPPGVTVDSPGVRAQLGSALASVQRVLPHARIASYASTGNRLFVSADGRTTFALIFLPADAAGVWSVAPQHAVITVLAHASIDGAPFRVTGLDVLATGGSSGGNSALVETVLAGVGALLVLAFVFGSVLAIVPLAMALVTIPTTFLVVWGLTTITDVNSIVEYLISLIGLGVAIDYSLLIVLRWREERMRGRDNVAAIQRAMETAGNAVVFSGTTVAIGMLALVVIPVPAIRSIGYGGLLIPLVSVLVATTLLPAILAIIGPTIDWPARRRPHQGRFWTAWGRTIVRRPWPAAIVAVVLLAGLIVPVFSMTAGAPKAASLSQSGDASRGLQELGHSGIGPGALSPFEVLVHGTNPPAAARTLAHAAGIRGAIAPAGPSWRMGNTALITVIPTADGASPQGRTALDTVRHIAATLPAGAGVGGTSAENADFLSAVYGNFPLMVVVLCTLTFLLLAHAFRSLLLPLKAVGLVLVSVAAAWGFMIIVWQDGHGSQLIWGIPATGSVTAWIPVMVFAFLFGISMDYEVFLLSRMCEEYDATGSTTAAVVRGIGSTGRLVTSAALILFLAFAALASGPGVSTKIIATGLGAGIIVDATVIRMLLVPALVTIVGRWNWWMPAPVARLLGMREFFGERKN